MKNKLYYQDPYIKSFTTHLKDQQKDEQGRVYAILEETAFYPTGGGQPYDTGTLNGIKVIDVEEIDGEIRHYIAQPFNEPGEITGEIDWERRFDHMQQHAGQHILSAAFEEKFGFATVSFHLGNEVLTIDLDIEELTDEQAEEAEDLANQIILENRSIETKWVTMDELSSYRLRKQLSVTENIRLVIIPDFDYNGCGGTHPHSTGEVKAIKILDWEKQRKKIRVHFVCGDRVLNQLHQKQKEIKRLTSILNAPEENLADTAKKLIEDKKMLEKSIEELKDELVAYEAKDLLTNGKSSSNGLIISKQFKNRSIQEVQKLARAVTVLSEEAVVFFVNDAEVKLQFVCAKGKAPNGSMKEITNKLLPLINGKGGGNDLFAQGGGEALITAEQLFHQGLEYMEQD
ncbi:DHHA1 domain-containing protein [Cytobacillus solani]|uniref:alanyl-tRNA editing protein n=1 Tax=Cytobacillus solani TaxID=1637975 RepID=UPI000A4A77D2|nr:DHHA1 domain-containing protein [Cytobacillus solani]USK55437.1 DHHA1 domain-containing protein [Cytobacillus solani]